MSPTTELIQKLMDAIKDLEEELDMCQSKNAYLMTRCEEAESKIATFQSILKEY